MAIAIPADPSVRDRDGTAWRAHSADRGTCLERIPLPVHTFRSRDQHARLAAALDHRDQIAQYGIEKWTALRGYGIRGVGNTRAYVWGNKVVHITTLEGEVFLGHNDPARMVRDLDTMKQYAHS